jgi:HEAT repeat protein
MGRAGTPWAGVLLCLGAVVYVRLLQPQTRAGEKQPGQSARPEPTAEEKKRLEGLVKKLKSQEPKERRDGADGLAVLGPVARAAVPELLELLSDRNEGVRAAAAQALLQIDPGHAKKALAVLADLADEGIDNTEAFRVPPFEENLRQDHFAAQLRKLPLGNQEILAGLLELVRTRPLGAPSWGAAFVTLEELEPPARQQLVPVLEAGLREDKPRGLYVTESLRKINPKRARTAARAMVRDMKTEKPAVRRGKTSLILALDPTLAGETAEVLLEDLKADDPEVRRQAIAEIAQEGRAMAGAEEGLRAALRRNQQTQILNPRDPEIALEGVLLADALLRIRPEKGRELGEELIREFAGLMKLKDLSKFQRDSADVEIRCLREVIGFTKLPPHVIEIGEKPKPKLIADTKALAKCVRGESPFPGLRLKESGVSVGLHEAIRSQAAYALGDRPDAKDVVGDLLGSYHHLTYTKESSGLRREVAEALKQIDPEVARKAGIR